MKAVVAFVTILLVVACTNRPPVIEAIVANPDTVTVNGQSKIEAVVTDPEGDILRYFWTASSGTLSPSTAETVTWTAPKLVGAYEISLTVRDAKENACDTSVTVTVRSGGLQKLR